MSFTVRELPKAKQDKRSIFCWLDQRSPAGAVAWLDAYDALLERLKQDAPAFSEAPENRNCDFDVRQSLFKTRRGRVDRVLSFVEGQEVFIVRLRGPGQAPIAPEEMT